MTVMLMTIQRPRWCPMCGTDSRWGWGMMLGWMLLWLLVLAAVSVVVWRLAGGRGLPPAGGGATPRGPSADEILGERYARGEIDRDTYLRMREDLGRRPPA